MTADVYAGDEDLNRVDAPAQRLSSIHLTVRADADPDVLFRIAAQLNFLGCPPRRFYFVQDAATEVVADIWLSGCSDALIAAVRRKLAALTCVHEVAVQDAAT